MSPFENAGHMPHLGHARGERARGITRSRGRMLSRTLLVRVADVAIRAAQKSRGFVANAGLRAEHRSPSAPLRHRVAHSEVIDRRSCAQREGRSCEIGNRSEG